MQIISLFSGIGGFEMAGVPLGWPVVAKCEIEPRACQVLQHYWPKAYLHGDVRDFGKKALQEKSKWDEKQPTILVAGFPCQPYSITGKRKGDEDGRHLWPQVERTVREIRPRWVLAENVYGILNWNDGRVHHEVLSSLEAQGYTTISVVLPASSVGAVHRRDRVWFVAHIDEGTEAALPADSLAVEERGHDVRKQERGEEHGKQCLGLPDICGAGKGGQPHVRDIQISQAHGPENSTDDGGDEGAWLRSQWSRDIFPKGGRIEPPVLGLGDGVPAGMDSKAVSKWANWSIGAFGNTICPQVAHAIYLSIIETEKVLYHERT